MMGDLLIAWTIRVALACFLFSICCWGIADWAKPQWPESRRIMLRRIARWLWTFGFVSFVGHVLSAFEFHFAWSQSRAVAETSRQTKELLGIEFGGGLFFNYAFLVLWLVDTVWVWRRGLDVRMHWLRWLVISYLAFIAFNGTVVFKTGWLRWVGVAGTVLLVLFLLPLVLRRKS